MAKTPLAVKRKATLSAYKPSLREQAAILGEKGFKALTGREPGYEARENINRYTGLLDLLEVPGAVLSANEAARNIKSKQYGAAAGDIAGLAAGAIPIAGGALKKGAKKVVEEGVEGLSKLATKYFPESENSFLGQNSPTLAQMQSYSRVENVPLNMARSTQRHMEWDKFNKGQYSDPVVEGYQDLPVVGKNERGEYLIFDGHHRSAKALMAGETHAPMHVIDLKDYDPANAGRKKAAVPTSENDQRLLDELYAELSPPENLTTKYDLPPVITGAEREANLARFMEGSQVVDAEGKPLTVYHGARGNFEGDTFKVITKKGVNEEPTAQPIFFSSTPEGAHDYAKGTLGSHIIPAHLKINKLFDPAKLIRSDAKSTDWWRDQATPFGKELYDAIDEGKLGKDFAENPDSSFQAIVGGNYDAIESKEVQDWLKKKGFDGFKTYEGQENYAVFDPNQIKSKYNIGTFDPTIPHIGKAHGGPVSLSDKYGC